VPGADLGGLYYVKNIRQAMDWDKVLDKTRAAVVVEASPLGLEMVTALCHRGIETHLVDPDAWALAAATDPDIAAPVQDSWVEKGAKLHFNTTLQGFVGDGTVRAVATSAGEIPCDLAVVCTKKEANTDLARAAGLRVGSANGIIVDERMQTSAPGVWAAGDCIEVPHSVTNIPIQGLSGSHAYAQGKVAGTNAAGGQRRYQPVSVPWGMVAGDWMIGGVSFSETLATALGIPHVVGTAEGISGPATPGVEEDQGRCWPSPDSAYRRADGRARGLRAPPHRACEDRHHDPRPHDGERYSPIGALNDVALAAQVLAA
jgi:NADH oxidase (H2O2-forming)